LSRHEEKEKNPMPTKRPAAAIVISNMTRQPYSDGEKLAFAQLSAKGKIA
jgi:hypothetical protein